jgi:serine/threonine-protein kinase
MDEGHHDKLSELFERAVDLPPEARADFLEVCSDDPAVRRELRSLLAAHDRSPHLLERLAREVLPAALEAVAEDDNRSRAGVYPAQGPASTSEVSGQAAKVLATGTALGSYKMTLAPGTRIGPYEIVSMVGAGGMGEVYRAHDARLGRHVALKILKTVFASDPERIARFDREARTLAALNHPHIGAIYGVEETDGLRALALEFVDGDTLADRIARGPIPLEEALPIAGQIAEALRAAHEHGIIHRDLKPANIKVTSEGVVKVLDFGLAKLADAPVSAARASPSLSATLTSPAGMTQASLLLGTAAYVAPEQARGTPADKRSDIWAFGCVLYEMLTGKRAFDGEGVTETLATVLKHEPDWAALPSSLPVPIRAFLAKSLVKDRRRRIGDISTALFVLEQLSLETPTGAATVRGGPRWRSLVVAGMALTIVVGALAGWVTWRVIRQSAAPHAPVQRFTIPMPATAQYEGGELAISPDGTRIVYPANEGRRRVLYLHALDQLTATVLAGSDDAFSPFFSPDGEWIAFFAGAGSPANTLKKVPVRGGASVTICPAPYAPAGGVWRPDGTIVFASASVAPRRWTLFQVAATGATPTVLVDPDPNTNENVAWPALIPGTDAILFTIGTPGFAASWRLVVWSRTNGTPKTVVKQGYHGRYVPTGHLVFMRGTTLMAVPFDPKRLETTGDAVPVIEGVRTRTSAGEASFAISQTGFLVYQTVGTTSDRSLVWVNRDGTEEPVDMPSGAYGPVRISPKEGTLVALEIRDQKRHIGIWDFNRRILTPLTSENTGVPVWTNDGRRIAFASLRAGGAPNVYWQIADGSVKPERLTDGPTHQLPLAFSRDDKWLLFSEANPPSIDLKMLSLDDARRIVPLFQSGARYLRAAVSPDGRWLAYQSIDSSQSDRSDIYLSPFPDVSRWRKQVSSSGGTDPAWARSGRELYYRSLSAPPYLMAVTVQWHARMSESAPLLSAPFEVFAGSFIPGTLVPEPYDVSPGGRFLVTKTNVGKSQAPLTVVLNWVDELKKLVPAAR